MFDKFALEYDKWFDENKEIYQSELLALKETIPTNRKGLEVGIGTALKGAYRVLKENGEIIIGLIDKNSYLGKRYEKIKKNNKFYKDARFYSVDEIINLLEFHNFCGFVFYQILVNPNKRVMEKPQTGYGKGSFVVVKSAKK